MGWTSVGVLGRVDAVTPLQEHPELLLLGSDALHTLGEDDRTVVVGATVWAASVRAALRAAKRLQEFDG